MELQETIVNNIDISKNFWDIYPVLKSTGMTKHEYLNDKSKNKEKSSLLMWSIIILIDPVLSPYKNMLDAEKKNLIAEDILKNPDFDWQEIAYLISYMEKLYLTKIKRSLRNWGLKLEERDDFIKSTEYSVDNGKDLDAIISNTPKMYDMYDKAIEKYNEKMREASGKTKGMRPESASEKGLV